MGGAGARIGSFLAGAGCCLLSERIEPLALACTASPEFAEIRRFPVFGDDWVNVTYRR